MEFRKVNQGRVVGEEVEELKVEEWKRKKPLTQRAQRKRHGDHREEKRTGLKTGQYKSAREPKQRKKNPHPQKTEGGAPDVMTLEVCGAGRGLPRYLRRV